MTENHGGVGRRTSRSDSYMEQENEWEREGLLDPAWEQQQKKVRSFTCLSMYFDRKVLHLTEKFVHAKISCY